MRTRLGPGLTGYSCGRAFLAWNLAVCAAYFTLTHYHLVPEFAPRDFGDSSYLIKYLYDVSGRTQKDAFCLPMALILFGSMGYALCLLVALRATSRQLASAGEVRSSWVNRLVGLPTLSTGDALTRFVGRGAAYATAPLRDAVTLFPALGFLGTVVGVTIALGGLHKVMAKGDSSELMSGLLTAFDTTFLGLLAALVLTLVLLGVDAATAQIGALLDDERQKEAELA